MSTQAKVVAATRYRGVETILWISSGQINWPKRCACCFGVADATQELRSEERAVAVYPICTICRNHASRDIKIVLAAAVFGLVVMAIVIWFVPVIPRRGGLWLAFLLAALIFIAAGSGAYRIMGELWGAKTPACPDGGWPVEVCTIEGAGLNKVLGNNSERMDEKELREFSRKAASMAGVEAIGLMMRNKEYADQFLLANGGEILSVGEIKDRI